jgi:hypothetical protein
MKRRSGKRSSSAGSEKMKRVGDRYGKMERYCSTGQNRRWAVASMEEEVCELYVIQSVIRCWRAGADIGHCAVIDVVRCKCEQACCHPPLYSDVAPFVPPINVGYSRSSV